MNIDLEVFLYLEALILISFLYKLEFSLKKIKLPVITSRFLLCLRGINAEVTELSGGLESKSRN